MWIGCAVVATVLAFNSIGVFRWLEDWTLDLRFRYGRWEIEDPGKQIALVAIDDASLDTIGRWPWKRSLMAQATDEMARAGAKTIAFDILFVEPEDETTGDKDLAEAMGKVNCVVALAMREEKVLNPVWETSKGQQQLAAFTNAVAAGMDRDINVILAQAEMVEPFKSLVLERPAALKGLAALMYLEQLRKQGKLPKTFDDFVNVMLGGGASTKYMGEFAEKKTLERVWLRSQSWRAIENTFSPDVAVKGTPQDLPPIPLIAKAAKSAGVVNAEPDKFDGKLRQIFPYFQSDYGWAPQFGLAAALAFQGLTVRDAVQSEGQLQLKQVAIPMRDGKVLLNWPTQLLAGYGNKEGRNATLGIGRLIEQARARQQLAKQTDRFLELGKELAVDVDEYEKDGKIIPTFVSLLGHKKEWFDKASKDGRLKKELVDRWEEDGYKDLLEKQARDPNYKPEIAFSTKEFLDLKQSFDSEDVSKSAEGLNNDWLQRQKTLIQDQIDSKKAYAIMEWFNTEKALEEGSAKVQESDAQLREILGGKLVFVGFTATGVMADMINTIFGPRTPGVFGHIAVADMVLNERVLTFAPAWIGPLALIVLGLVSTLMASRFGAGIGAFVVLFLLFAYIGTLGVFAFDQGEWIFPMAAPVTSGFSAWLVTTVAMAVITRREKQRVTRQFRARVSPQLVEMLAKDPNSLSMGGVEREATILFGDLAGFTSISEVLGGPAVVSTLNLYMGAMTKELTERRAYVNKFLGDGILAFWSAFGEEPEQGRLSIEAALACQKAVNEIGKRPDRQGLPLVSLRLGMATGKVVIGDCGAPPDLNDYTMIGDSGNLAARLESANKQFGSAILIDGRTAELSKGSGLALLSLGRVVVVGQTIPIDLFEVCLEDDPTSRIEVTETMVRLFTACKFDECRASLANLQKTLPGSKKLVHAFMDALDNPEDLRDGVLRLRAK